MTYDHFDSDTQVFDGRVHDFKIGIPVADRKRPCANYDYIPAFRGISTFHIGSPKGRRLYDSYIRLFRWAKQHGYRMENWSVEDWLIHPLTTATPVAGVTLGHRLIPVQNVGIYVPAGRYPLPSTALMLTIPAKVAAVEKVVACSPAFKGAFIWRLAIILMFRDVPLEGTAKVVYFVFLNVIFWFSGTMCVIPHSSLGADLTDDYNGRNKLRTFAVFGLNIGMLIATGVPLMVVSFFQNLTDGTEKSGWAYTALEYGLIVNKLGKKATMALGLVIYGAAYLIVQFLPLNYTTAVLNAVLVGAAIMLRYGMDKKAYTTLEAAYEKKQKGEAYDLGEYADMIR